MSYKSWEDIYRSKETQELYKIFKGINNSTYDQKKLAHKILEERKFDLENTGSQIKEWNRINKRREEDKKNNSPILHILLSNAGYIIATIALILFLIAFGEFLKLDRKDLGGELGFGLYMITFGPLITVIVGLIIQYLIRKKKKN